MKKLSARNQLKGKILEVKKGTTTSHVRIDIGNGIIIVPRSDGRVGTSSG
jgi:molybdopterin-binding protein